MDAPVISQTVKEEPMQLNTSYSTQKRLHLDVLIEKQKDCYTAHCLQLDVITEGETRAEAEEMIVDAIGEQLAFAIDNNLMDYLLRPAEPEEWRKLLYSHDRKKFTLDIYHISENQ
jgi:predicted RNase H-like HicB family nuclease